MLLTMQLRLVVLVATLSLIPMVLSKYQRLMKSHHSAFLSKARCDLVCFEASKETKSQCRSQCRTQEQKPGTCPVQDSPKWAAACVEACNADSQCDGTQRCCHHGCGSSCSEPTDLHNLPGACPVQDSPKWAAACVEACNADSQCDGTQRCCHHGCGSSCSEPTDLHNLPGLPALPTVDKIKEKKRGVVIQWSDGVGDAARAVPGKILYLLEEQSHVGPKFEEARLGEWKVLLRTNRNKTSLRNLLKPGHWYRFRVAAISASGTRGFSAPSAPFTPRKGPRPPPPPKKLKVRPVKAENGTVTVKLEWKAPNSDLPVIRYKVFWSRRVKGLNGPLDSVLVKHQSVPKDRNFIEICDLQPNSMYFLQVQTVSQFGDSKLRSNRASIFYNTTSSVQDNQRIDIVPEQLQRRDKKVKGLKLHKIIWYNHKLKANITWEAVPPKDDQTPRYHVQWKTLKCQNHRSAKKELSAITELTSFEIYELNYRCSYKVNVNIENKTKYPDAELIINVPGCEYFKKKLSTNTLQCETLH